MAKTPIDFQSAAWLQIAAWATQQQQDIRVKNDGLELTAEQTAAYRGELRLLKRLLGLPAEAARQSEAGSASTDRPFGDWGPEGS